MGCVVKLNKFYTNKANGKKYFAERLAVDFHTSHNVVIFFNVLNEVDFDNPIVIEVVNFNREFKEYTFDVKIGDKVWVKGKQKEVMRINLPIFTATDYTIWDLNEIENVL